MMNQFARHKCAATATAILIAGPVAAIAGPEEDLRAGIDAFNQGDVTAAIALYRVAADAGLAEAQVRLAYILDYSEENTEAVMWYRAAAQQGNADGQFGLGEMYAKGEGIERDLVKAFEYIELAAENGHQRAIRVLSQAYEDGGLGLQVKPEQAAYWKNRLATESPDNE
jgi:hypothetical protein